MNKTEIKRNYSQPSAVENDNKNNYLPWILGGVGIFALIAGLVWYFTRKENK